MLYDDSDDLHAWRIVYLAILSGHRHTLAGVQTDVGNTKIHCDKSDTS